MRYCAKCGRRVVLGGRRSLKRMDRIEKLVEQLDQARRRAESGLPGAPPEVRSALLEVTPLLAPLLTAGMTIAVDLHELSHDADYPLERSEVAAWEGQAERALSELLFALGSIS